MWNKASKILLVIAMCALSAKKSLGQPSQVQVSLGDREPIVKSLAGCISKNLQSSQVLGALAQFSVTAPSDLIFRVTSMFLNQAGVCDPELANGAADAVSQLGQLTSSQYFDTIGSTAATFLFSQGLVTPDSVDAVCLKVVSSMELQACAIGITDTESVMNAVGYGFLNVMQQYGLIDNQVVSNLIKLYSGTLGLL